MRRKQTSKTRSGRPERLHYRSRDGVYETHFPFDGGDFEFSQFVGKALTWSEDGASGDFALLDTFLSDSMNAALLERILRAKRPEGPLKILLADPTSSFALARGGSIQQDTLDESIRGLSTVLEALNKLSGASTGVRVKPIRENDGGGNDERLRLVREHMEAVHGFPEQVDLRFYVGAASGPLYFFRDIVLAGRFGAGTSAIRLPWTMVVKDPTYVVEDPTCIDDLFCTFEAEFNHLWGLASRDLGGGQQEESRVFLSYAEADRAIAEDLRTALEGADVEVFMAGHDIGPSEAWIEVLRVNLIRSSHAVMLLTPSAVTRPWILTEAGAAWALGKTIIPVLAGLPPSSLPDVLAYRQAVDMSSGVGMARAVDQISNLIHRAKGLRTQGHPSNGPARSNDTTLREEGLALEPGAKQPTL